MNETKKAAPGDQAGSGKAMDELTTHKSVFNSDFTSKRHENQAKEKYTVLVIHGDFIDFVENPKTEALTFEDLSAEETNEICMLSFRQGFQCVIERSDADWIRGGADCAT